MIDLNDSKHLKITKEELLDRYTEYEIFKHYIGDFELGETYSSPLRTDDNTPSFNIFYSARNGCLLFKDFAGKRGDCIRFVQYLMGLATYNDAIQQIAKDMPHYYSIRTQPKLLVLPEKRITCDIKIVARNWENKDLNYWKQYGISKYTLNTYNVIPIEGYYHNEKYISTKDIAYAYLEFKDKKLTYKIYRPTADKSKKWRNNNPYGVHQGYRQLPHSGDLLIITKSLKDVMSIYENTNIPSVAIQSETCFIKESVVNEYKFRFDRVITLFDNDRQGIEQAKSYWRLYQIPSIFIPDQFEVKDFSDLVKKIGKKMAIKVLKEIYAINISREIL